MIRRLGFGRAWAGLVVPKGLEGCGSRYDCIEGVEKSGEAWKGGRERALKIDHWWLRCACL